MTFELNLISRPWFLNSLYDSFDISGSAIGRKSSNASRIVTSDPSLDHTLPNSNPIIPAPTIPTVFGNFLNDNAPVLSTIFSLKLAEGISIGLEPVAKIMFFVSIFSIDPSVFVTSTILFYTTLPFPEIDWTLFAANRPLNPPVSLETMSSLRFIIDLRSNFKSPTTIPWSARFLLAS